MIEAATDLLKFNKAKCTYRKQKLFPTAAPGRKFVSLVDSFTPTKALLPGPKKKRTKCTHFELFLFEVIDSFIKRTLYWGKNSSAGD